MSETSSKGVDRRAMAGLSAGHLFTDLNQGAVAALVPFLIAERGLSLAAAGALVFAATVSSSIVQPLFGIFSDRRPIPALMPLGVLLAGCRHGARRRGAELPPDPALRRGEWYRGGCLPP